jgi:hypothetical protein
MIPSTTTTVTMNGNSTGYGLFSGNEVFELDGYHNTVLLSGANDTVNINGGEYDSIDLNSTGFSHAVTDTINLGSSAFNSVTASHALSDAAVSITGIVGPNTISLVNHGGSTSVTLGNDGDTSFQSGLGLNDAVSLNGDASNSVAFTSGGGAVVTIGSAGDGFSKFASKISLVGIDNVVTGGDEQFTVNDLTGQLNKVTLGNGNNAIALGGDDNSVTLGNGSNTVSLTGLFDDVTFGTGSNTISTSNSVDTLIFGAGGAGSTDTLNITGGSAYIHSGNENINLNSGTKGTTLVGTLGNGDNTLNMGFAAARLTIGTTTANTATNVVNVGRGESQLVFNGGTDQVNLADGTGITGFDSVTLNGTTLGTTLTAHGAFDQVTLSQDANATINDASSNGGLSITIDESSTGGIGTIAITGLSGDDLAKIHLVGSGTYTITPDPTAVGGITLHFSTGSIDLVGLQSVPNTLITG